MSFGNSEKITLHYNLVEFLGVVIMNLNYDKTMFCDVILMKPLKYLWYVFLFCLAY